MSFEAIRKWCVKFGPAYAGALRHRQRQLGDIWHGDEVFISIRGERHYPWRAVDQYGDVLEILVTRPRNARAARRFFRKLLKERGGLPFQLVTDKLRYLSPSSFWRSECPAFKSRSAFVLRPSSELDPARRK